MKGNATHRHVKRGSEYVLIGMGKMQTDEWFDAAALTAKLMSDDPSSEGTESVDMREVAIYRSVDDGSLWVRPREEFDDGRFTALIPQSTTTDNRIVDVVAWMDPQGDVYTAAIGPRAHTMVGLVLHSDMADALASSQAEVARLREALRQMVVNSEADGNSYRDCHRNALIAIARAEDKP